MIIRLFYRYYPYSGLATFISVISNIAAIITFFTGLYMLLVLENRTLGIPLGIFFMLITAFLFIFVGRILTDRLSEKWSRKNIETKVFTALAYCQENPEEYEQVATVNTKFAEKYMKNEKGKIVKRK